MRVALRASVVAVSALVVAVAVGIAATMPSIVAAVALASTTVLIMGGTGHPLSTAADTISYVKQYMGTAVANFVSPSSTASAGIAGGPYNSVAVITPEEHAPNYGTLTLRQSVMKGVAALHSCITSEICDHNPDVGSTAPSPADTFVVFGYSQSAAVAMLEKTWLAALFDEGEGPDISFVTIGGSRPNGGLVARDTTGFVTTLLLGVTREELITDPAPTDTHYSSVDIALQYDGFVDFPLNPLNLLASLNAYMGISLLHPTYNEHRVDEPGVIDQGRYGDTRYYMIPAESLPLLVPIANIPLIGPALADSWDPVLRVLVESAYDRGTSPGVPTAFDLSYSENLFQLARNVIAAIPIGMDNGVESLFGVRPLGTQRPGAYGVGGHDFDSMAAEPVVSNFSTSAEPATSSDHEAHAAGIPDEQMSVGPSAESSEPEQSELSTGTDVDFSLSASQDETTAEHENVDVSTAAEHESTSAEQSNDTDSEQDSQDCGSQDPSDSGAEATTSP
ncbi:PE-PPE domain-containing protein [Mycolicibacterium sp. BiH015]|uniref:PE-PPE domain-containing protein n=1 Tax=Mycolicibacterium sp. BiH015 TaxID=3018808 RepID=UPI0022E4D3EF|nr:PE-PPE domain-containing protein [Mycolicibacterium sp. BiH015]MDA2895488.1 PE-PPE domain-containing protein [Mycolicibacterium sp. BiH015]